MAIPAKSDPANRPGFALVSANLHENEDAAVRVGPRTDEHHPVERRAEMVAEDLVAHTLT
jgi:hypothetical protein